MVLGSALFAFNEICPSRWDFIHPNYRKLCALVSDLDEWGQTVCLEILTRYVRIHFLDPKKQAQEKAELKKKKNLKKLQKDTSKATEGESSEEEDDEEEEDDIYQVNGGSELDPDISLLLKSALPLLQSRNSSVVLAVVTLYHYIGDGMEDKKISKSLLRTLRTNKESRFFILTGILSIIHSQADTFRPYLTDFFVETSDPIFIQKTKLSIITVLANEANISRILREFKIYVCQENKTFVQLTIQAIGNCATRIPEVVETCMESLASLIGNSNEAVVAEAIVVLKKLIQLETNQPKPKESNKKSPMNNVISHMSKLLDTVKAPDARASIIWIISEHVSQLQKTAPDVLRQLAKTFCVEDYLVKLQILNLAVKLFITNSEQTNLLFQYILNLAKYDTSYDLRDRARIIRRIVLNTGEKAPILNENASNLFITKKPTPSVTDIIPIDQDRHPFYPGSFSCALGHTTFGYKPIPDWTNEQISSQLRNTIKAEWENFRYSNGSTLGSIQNTRSLTAMGSNPLNSPLQNSPITHFNPNSSLATQPAHKLAGFSTKEEYEQNFWGDSSEEDENIVDSNNSASEDSSDSENSNSSTDNDDEESVIENSFDNDLFEPEQENLDTLNTNEYLSNNETQNQNEKTQNEEKTFE